MSPYNLIVILGPTASGKTKLAAKVASELATEVISADSRQVYRNMNIGTGKDLQEYIVHGKQVPYHLIDILEAGDTYNVYSYHQDFFYVFDQISAKNKIPVLCGGTGLYIDAVLKGYVHSAIPVNESLRAGLPESKEQLLEIFNLLPDVSYKKEADVSTVKRLIRAIEICTWEQDHTRKTNERSQQLKPVVFGLNADKEMRIRKIEERLKHRLQEGLIEEVNSLREKGISDEKLIWYGLEYKFVVMYLRDELTLDELYTQLAIAIRQFAKRQMTWFRKMEREGTKINWIDASLPVEEQLQQVLAMINQ